MLGQVVFLKTGDVYDFIRFSGSHCLIWKSAHGTASHAGAEDHSSWRSAPRMRNVPLFTGLGIVKWLLNLYTERIKCRWQ